MACKCTQTTVNATGGGAITSPLSACTEPLWINQVSGCTGSALDVHFGNPGANILFNIGQYDYSEVGFATNNIGINVPNPIHTLSVGGTIDVEDYLHMGEEALTGSSSGSVYLGYNAGSTRGVNSNSSKNTAIGHKTIGNGGTLNGATDNTAIGHGTGGNITSGYRNTIIGSLAGNAITSQSGNLYLGYGQGYFATTENNTLRIGNNLNGNETDSSNGQYRPLIHGDFATSGFTVFGNARITEIPEGRGAMLVVDKDGFVQIGKFPRKGVNTDLRIDNTGIWTANTTDASGASLDGIGYRSVSISGGTNHTTTNTDWAGTRVGIGTDLPEFPLHIKGPYAWMKAQSTSSSSWIESQSSGNNAYLGVSAGDGVKSGSTSWRMHAFTSSAGIYNWKVGANQSIGSGMTLQVRSQSNGDETVSDVISILGDNMSNNLDGAIVVRSDENPLGGTSNPTQGIGIFTPVPTKELTVVGSISGTGSIHSTDYIKFPNPSNSTHIGFQAGSGTTDDTKNVGVGYQSMANLDGSGSLSNVAVGFQSMLSSAGQEFSENVAIGAKAMLTSADGTNKNVAVGTEAFSTPRGGSTNNVAIGYQALPGTLAKVSTENTVVGRGAGNQVDSQNTIIGAYAYQLATGGDENTIIGATAGQEVTASGSFNTFLGHSAGRGAGGGTGHGNLYLGFGAASAATTESSGIAIGYNAAIPYSEDHFMNIGDIIYGRKMESGTGGRDTVMIGSGAYSNAHKYFTLGVVGPVSATGVVQATNHIKFMDVNNSVAIGYNQILGTGDSTSIRNTFIGYGINNENEMNNCDYNTAVGWHNMRYIQSNSHSNTSIGSQTLEELTTGDENTAVGATAMRDVESGSNNIAVGSYAQGGTSTSSNNTAVGNYALAQNGMTGEFNTTVGDYTMGSLNTGNNNTGMGRYSMAAVTSGSFNVAMGDDSEIRNQTGNHNVAIGHKASFGVSSQSHSFNTSVGSGALSGITTGDCNVVIGNNAGTGVGQTASVSGTSRITTGSKNVVIGCHANIKDGTSNNQTSINNTIFTNVGTGGNTVLTADPIEPDKIHDVYTNGDIIIKPTTGLIISASTVGTTIQGPIRTKDPLTFSNTVIGEMSLKGDTKTSNTQQNTSIGYQALSNPSLTSSLYNTAIGYRALSASTSVRSTTAIGNRAQESNTTGGFNTSVGDGAILNNQTGSYNVGIGYMSLQGLALHSHNRNTAVGYEAGRNTVTGSNNLMLGWQAGDNITTGNANVIIGAGTDAPDSGGDYQLNISNVLYGADVYSSTATKEIGINRTTPKTALDVVYENVTSIVNDTGGGDIVTFGSAGADYAAGFLVQLRGTDNWVKADADDTTLQGNLVGIALGAAPSDGILLKGFYKINTADDVTTWANGGQLYVSTTDGKITESTGSMSSGDYVRVVGYMTSTTNVMYFDPESTYIVVT